MSTKRSRVRCPKCNRRMSKPSNYEWFGYVRGTIRNGAEYDGHTQDWQTICLACVREHFADPLLHLRKHKAESVRERTA